jgi:chromosome segregation ATPase
MEVEQILKQVDWLDKQRLNDKNTLAVLEDRLNNFDGTMQSVLQQIKELNGEVISMKTLLPRLDSLEEGTLKQKKEAKKLVDNLEKELQRREEERKKVERVEMSSVDASISEIRKEMGALAEMRRGLQTRSEEDLRLQRSIEEVRDRVEALRRNEEESTRQYRLIEDGRRQDAKRLTDTQGELTSLRKRADDLRAQIEVNSASIRKVESRLTEAEVAEGERRKTQVKFLEDQALIQVEREKTWKEWQSKFDTIEKQTVEIESTLQTLDGTNRSVAHTQQTVDELAQKVDRRIAEMAEIQRLTEERFRQEWVTFKADDQKRWTNYTLIQDEQRGEIVRQTEKLNERLVLIEDNMQEAQDLLQMVNDLTEKRLQSMLAATHEMVTSFERAFGRSRK